MAEGKQHGRVIQQDVPDGMFGGTGTRAASNRAPRTARAKQVGAEEADFSWFHLYLELAKQVDDVESVCTRCAGYYSVRRSLQLNPRTPVCECAERRQRLRDCLRQLKIIIDR